MACATVFVFPFIAVVILFLIDFFEWTNSAREEFPVKTVIGSFVMWLLVGIPSCYFGACYAMKGGAEPS